ncbi:hypothetical protein P7K49_026395 [Saguinus oedipus]|uniref:Uncharacterized protein n=1 Tax=Saguinus oedipus TaxID=9490 RepID=A0ABQ9UD21_SAGOE|nr:hypothetical protein P7K49_026395 [Saguinus oedipus]
MALDIQEKPGEGRDPLVLVPWPPGSTLEGDFTSLQPASRTALTPPVPQVSLGQKAVDLCLPNLVDDESH